jgi:hypothetical protein
VLALLGLLLLAALAVAGWYFVPQLRALIGAAPAEVPVAQAPDAAPPAAPAPAAPRVAEAAPPPRAGEPSAPRSMAQGPPPRPAPVRLMNVASETISRLFVARADQGIGQEDWLGQAQITPGNAVLLRPPPGQGCLFNIRVVYVGGRAEDRPGVDLCTAPELRFEGNKAASGAPPR